MPHPWCKTYLVMSSQISLGTAPLTHFAGCLSAAFPTAWLAAREATSRLLASVPNAVTRGCS